MKFKNYTKHLVAFIMLLTTLHAYAASVGDSFSYECENGKYLIFEITHSNTIKLTQVDDYECTGEVIIPFLVNFDASSYIVTEIGDWACDSRKNITSVTIPESVTKIGNNAFNNCNSLTTITIPKSVTEIGETALAGCDNLTAINVDSNNLHYTSEEGVLFNIEKTKLMQCPPAKYGTYTIPDGVDIIEDYAFAYNTYLTAVSIPDCVSYVGIGAFLSEAFFNRPEASFAVKDRAFLFFVYHQFSFSVQPPPIIEEFSSELSPDPPAGVLGIDGSSGVVGPSGTVGSPSVPKSSTAEPSRHS